MRFETTTLFASVAFAGALVLTSCGAKNGGSGRADGGNGAGACIDSGLDPAIDNDGDGYSKNAGDCDDCNPNVHPGAKEICNGVDDNCNNKTDEVCDYDGDGYTFDQDCDDHEPLVNPGAYEVVGNGIDDNCNGHVDEITPPCDGSRAADGVSLAGSIELCSPWLQSAAINDGVKAPDPLSHAVFSSYGVVKPKGGTSFIVLSTGIAASETDPKYVDPQPGTEFTNDAPNPKPMNVKNNVCGKATADPGTVHDYVELKLTLKVPTNARSFSFSFNFMSAEYPEYVGSAYNDKFLALLSSKSLPEPWNNISFDQNKNPITVNVGFFNVCNSSAICDGTKTNACTPSSLQQLTGTGYELDDGSGRPIGGGTGWLTTTSPVTPGETATLRFIIFDESDHLIDSAVIIDNFQWQLMAASAATTIQ